jgi:PAS domain S-box-containing protein
MDKYCSIFENLIEGIFQTTQDGRYLSANPALAKLYGYESPQALIESLTDIEHQLYVNPARRRELIHLIEQQGAVAGFESQVYRRDGRIIWISENVYPVYSADGDFLYYEGTVTDISDRKRTQEALQASEQALACRERYFMALVEVQTCLLAQTDPSELYESILEILGRVSGVSRAYIFENHPDASGNLLMSKRAEWCAAGIPPEIDNPLLQNLPYHPYFSRWQEVLTAGGVIDGRIQDFPLAEQDLLKAQGILSILVLPLTVNTKFWGFIGFDNCVQARSLDEMEIRLLQSAASALALALERRQADLQLRQQAERERLLRAIALRIRQSLNLDEILACTAEEIRQVLQADRVLIYRFDNCQGVLVAASVQENWDVQAQLDSHQIWYRDAAVDYDESQTQVVHDVEAHGFADQYLVLMRHLQIKAKIIVPLLQGDHCWGVLTVHQCSTPRRWQEFEIDLVQQLAIQVAIAIQQAQLFSQLQQQTQREQLLNQISQTLHSSHDPNYILQEIVNRTGVSFAVDRVLICAFDTEIRVLTEWRKNDQVVSMLNFRAPLSEWPDLIDPHSDFNQRRPFYAFDYSQVPSTPTRQRQIEQDQTRSVLSVPIFIHDKLFGSLALQTTTHYRAFTQDEIQFLSRIADQAAIALYNAQSYEYLEQLVQQRTQELEQEKRISEAASRAKSEFLATMSHELRTPLNAILGLSQILQQEIFGSLSPKQLDYINHIHSSGEHLLMLINDILDLAKVEAGRETLNLTKLGVSDLCKHCLALVQQQANEKRLQLLSEIDPAAQVCIADERRLKQILLNLLSNAVKFTPDGTVSLQVNKEPAGISFSVIDTGIGIPPEKLSLLFQPFSQLDSQLSRRYSGTGLGLALSRKLARLHGGDITVESTLNQGSRFVLYLPDCPVDYSEGCSNGLLASDRPPVTHLPAGRILLVEDDLCSATLLQDYLRTVGHQVDHLSDGTDFLKRVRAFKPHLILMDIQLSQEVTGLDLLQDLRSQPDLCHLPVVIVTAMAMNGDREKFLQAGATNYVSKPLDIVQLESLLMQYVHP